MLRDLLPVTIGINVVVVVVDEDDVVLYACSTWKGDERAGDGHWLRHADHFLGSPQ